MKKSGPMDLITGAAGIVGTHLAQQLAGRGRRVRVLDLKNWPLYPPGTDRIIGDVRDAAVVRRAVRGVENVYHLATLIAADRVSPSLLRSVIVDGGETVARLAHHAGASRIVMLTTSEVYGHIPDGPADENTPRRPLDEYGHAKKRLEDVLLLMARQGAPVTILRPTVIVGPRFQFSPLQRLFRLLAGGYPVPLIGDGSSRIHFVHVDDIVSLAMAAAAGKAAVGEAFNAGSDKVPSNLELMRALLEHSGSQSRLVPVPGRPARAVLRLLNRFMSPLFLEPGQFEIMGENYLLDLGKSSRLLGWKPARTNVQAFCDAYDWYLCTHPYPKPRRLRPSSKPDRLSGSGGQPE